MMNATTTVINDRFYVDLDDKSSFIGQGGMGDVYRGIEAETQNHVAIKMLKADLLVNDPETLQRFEREAEALRQLNHPNIVKILGSGQADHSNFLVMEYVSGGSLRDVLEREKRLSIQRALYIALDIADALTRAHRLNILHRDIKPDNVLMAEDGTPRLTDFGMARMQESPVITQEGMIVGTLAYLAPEAFSGSAYDERTDIWAFGIMLYEMLTGERPFPSRQPGQLINEIMTQPIADLETLHPEFPTALVDLLYRMLSKERDARIPSVRLIGAEIEALIRGESLSSSMQYVASVDASTGRFEIDSDEIPVSAIITPTAQHLVNVPNNLPHQPTPFIGREEELTEINNLLHSATDLITLIGPGGIGKTRLALASAEKQLAQFPDGVYLISTAPLDDPKFILPTIAEALNLTFSGGDDQQDLFNYLQEKKILLIFDNFEHLLDGSRLLSDIIQHAPDVSIIVTSRERLRLRSEQVYEVNGMRIPETEDESPEAMESFASAQLFTQSARRNLTNFAVDAPETAHQVAEIIRLVGGMPLGIELAAAWLDSMQLDEIIQEIETSLDFLETDLRDAPERHRSIRAVFEHSWNLINADERDVFMKLSVFRGGFEREAAQKIAGASLRTLTNLVNKSLLSRDPNGRYHVQKMLRQYAEDRFEEDPETREATYLAHCAYYGEFAEKIGAMINSPKENIAIEALDREHENIRLTWQRGIQKQHFDSLDRLQDTILDYSMAHSWLSEGYAMFASLVDGLEQARERNAIYWRAQNRKGWFGVRLGHYDESLKMAQGAEAFFAGKPSHKIESMITFNLISYIHMMQGDYDRAKEFAKKAMNLLEEEHKITAFYSGIANLGYAHYLAGEYQEALKLYEQLNANMEAEGAAPSTGAYLKNNLGEIFRNIGQQEKALALFEEAYAIFQKTNRKRGMAFTMLNIGGMRFLLHGQLDKSKEAYDLSLKLYREIGDKPGLAHAMSNLGNSAQICGDNETARTVYEASLKIRRELGDKRGIADSLSDLSTIMLNLEHLDEAEAMIKESLAIRIEIGDRLGEGMTYSAMSMYMLSVGRIEEARELTEKALNMGDISQNTFIQARGHSIYGDLALIDNDLDSALEHYKTVLRMTDVEPLILYALAGVADVYLRQGNDKEALRLLALAKESRSTFLTIIGDRIKKLFAEAEARLEPKLVETTVLQLKVLDLREVVQELIAQ